MFTYSGKTVQDSKAPVENYVSFKVSASLKFVHTPRNIYLFYGSDFILDSDIDHFNKITRLSMS